MTFMLFTLICVAAAVPGGHLLRRQRPTPPFSPPNTGEKDRLAHINASIVFGDETSPTNRGKTAPQLVPEGCVVMGYDYETQEVKKPISDLSLLQTMQGWWELLDYVRWDLALSDDDWDDIRVSDSEFLDKTNGGQSYWCPQLENTTWYWDPVSTCTENNQFAPVSLEGTGEILSGSARTTVQLGVSTKIERIIDKEFGTSLELKGSFAVPLLTKASARHETKWKLTVGVVQSKSTSEAVTQEISATVTSKNPRASCLLSLALKTCKLVGKGNVPVLASGWVWFHFPQKIKGHQNWAYQIESILTNNSDRTVSQHLDAEISSTSRGNASLTCDGVSIYPDTAGNATNLAAVAAVIN